MVVLFYPPRDNEDIFGKLKTNLFEDRGSWAAGATASCRGPRGTTRPSTTSRTTGDHAAKHNLEDHGGPRGQAQPAGRSEPYTAGAAKKFLSEI